MRDTMISASWVKRAGLTGRRLAVEIAISSIATLCVTLAFSAIQRENALFADLAAFSQFSPLNSATWSSVFEPGWFRGDSQRPLQESPMSAAAVAVAPVQAAPLFRDMPSLATLSLAGLPAPVAVVPAGRATEGIHGASAALPLNRPVRPAKSVKQESLPACIAPCVVGQTATPSAPSAPKTDMFDHLDVPAYL